MADRNYQMAIVDIAVVVWKKAGKTGINCIIKESVEIIKCTLDSTRQAGEAGNYI